MARSTDEWIGKTDDTPFPPRVRLRTFERDGGRCQCGCNRLIRVGEKWQTDHIKALINGGENRESNARTILTEHHKEKTAEDVAEKSVTYRKKSKNLGIRKKSSFACSRDSKFKKKMDGTVVVR
jgi:5-methylcytosine-specific restriction protein A